MIEPMRIDGYLVRIQGSVLKRGKQWTWEIYITIGPPTDNPITIGTPHDFLTEHAALIHMKAQIPEISRVIAEKTGAAVPDALMDFKEGKIRPMKDFEK